MLMPSKVSLIKYKKNYIGCLDNNYQRSVVFGFINQEHVKIVRNFLKYETTQIKKIDDHTFVISDKNLKFKKPLNRKELCIIKHESINTHLHMELNNIELKLIDIINQDNGVIKLISNFKMEIEIDNSLRLESLFANIEGEIFNALD